MRRAERSFRYGPRPTVTVPLAAVFTAVAAEMLLLAVAAGPVLRIVFGGVGVVAALLALAMVREVVTRVRGKRQIVVAARELVLPDGRPAIAYRDIRVLELRGTRGYQRVLHIRHAAGELGISGVMLGSVAELDELHGELKAARKAR